MYVRDVKEKTHQPEKKSAIAHTRHKARLRYAKRSRTKKPQTHTRGAEQAQSTPVEGRAKTRIGVQPAACVATYVAHGCVTPAKSNAKLPELLRDESGPREARPASLHCLGSQGPDAEQRQGRGPKASKDATDIGTKGRADDTPVYDISTLCGPPPTFHGVGVPFLLAPVVGWQAQQCNTASQKWMKQSTFRARWLRVRAGCMTADPAAAAAGSPQLQEH
jgi:hypothetical protein